jgi:nickel transport protein
VKNLLDNYKLRFCAIIIGIVLMFPSIGLGHRVIIFAWIEGDQVHTESKFASGKYIKGGQIEVYDSESKILIQGETDQDGRFTFPTPPKGDYKIVIQAALGHSGNWVLTKDAFEEEAVEVTHTSHSESTLETDDHMSPPTSVQSNVLAHVTLDELEHLIDHALDEKLAPISKQLAQLQTGKPSFKDIIGGIGYIVGLVGIALYFVQHRETKRRRKNDT